MSAPAPLRRSTDPGRGVAGSSAARRAPSRVAIVIHALYAGGAERAVCGLTKHWRRAGFDVSVVTLDARGSDVYRLEPGVRRVALDVLRPSRNRIEGGLSALRRVLALRRALLPLQADAIVSFLPRTNVACLLACAGTGIPVFVCERTDPRGASLGPPWTHLRRWLYPHAAGVVVQTESVGAWAREFCSRVHVIPNFVEPPSQVADPGLDRGPRRLVAMGRLVPEKGFDLLLEAFARIAAAHPDWELSILGEGRERPRLEALVASLGLERRVRMPGHVADPTPLLAAAHVFVLPSRHEGFPNALVEAMACGLPAVASACPSGPSEIITHGHDGLLVPPEDVAALSAALGTLLASGEERARMGRNAREVVAVLSPERVMLSWSALLGGAGSLRR